jgi:hypothetical protein
VTQKHDAQLPDRGGDILDDIRAALSRRGDLSDEHRAFYSEIVARFEGLAADRDRARRARDRYRDERNSERQRVAKLRARTEKAEGMLTAVHEKHSATSYDPSRCYCGNPYPCPTIRAVNDARPDLVDLPAEDLVEPGDEVPTLAELADRVAAIEERLRNESALSYSQGVEDMRERAAQVVRQRDYAGHGEDNATAIRDALLSHIKPAGGAE